MDDGKLPKQFEEAKKDNEWVEKIRQAGTAEELIQFYNEKGIEIPEEIKVRVCQMDKGIKKLDDEELTNVAGGSIFGCTGKYDALLCAWTLCPFFGVKLDTPEKGKKTFYCWLKSWEMVVE